MASAPLGSRKARRGRCRAGSSQAGFPPRSNTAPLFSIRPASPNSWTANAHRPAATKMSRTPVTEKKRRRSIRIAGDEERQADRDRQRETGDRPDRWAGTDARGREHGRHEQHRLETLARDRDERQAGERQDGAAGEGEIDTLLQVALHRPPLATHPEQHPRQDHHRQDRCDSLDASPGRRVAAGRSWPRRQPRRRPTGRRRDRTPSQTFGSASRRPTRTR